MPSFVARTARALLPALLWLIPTAARAQETPDAPAAVTIEQALAFGRAHHPQKLAARARVAAARRDADVPGSLWLPTVGGLAEVLGATTNNSTSTVLSNSIVDLPRIGATPIRDEPSWRLSPSSLVAIGARQTVYDFGRIGAQTTALTTQARAEEARAEAVEQDLDAQIALAFYDVLAAHAAQGVAERALTRSQARRAFLDAATGAGMRPTTDRTRAEADVARFEAARLRAEGSVRLARMRLASAIGSPAAEVEAAEPAAPAELPPVPTADAEAAVEAHDPVLRSLRWSERAQHEATRALAATGRPWLFATGTLSGRGGGAQPSSGSPSTGAGWLPVVPNLDVGLVLTVPLLDPTLSSRVEASRAREAVLHQEIEAARLRQIAFARQAQQAARLTDDSLGALTRAATTAAVNAEQAEARFKAGLGTVTEVAEAEALRVEAELQVVLGRFDARRARAALKRALTDKGMPW